MSGDERFAEQDAPFFEDKDTGEPCERRGAVLCHNPDWRNHRHVAIQRACCASRPGQEHRACVLTGTNEHGVAMCSCRHGARVHAWEPGEACSPSRVVPVLNFPPESRAT